MSTYKRILGAVLAVISVLTLFFGWVSAAGFVKDTLESEDWLLDALGSDWTEVRDELVDEQLDDLVDEILDEADDLSLPSKDLRTVSKSVKKIVSSVKDLALSPYDIAVISSSLGKLASLTREYAADELSTRELRTIKSAQTILTASTLLIWLIGLLGVAVIVTRVLGKSKVLDIVYFVFMILLTALLAYGASTVNKALEGESLFYYFTIDGNILRLTLWPFIGILFALPIGVLPDVKHTAAAPKRVCPSCGSSLDTSDRFCQSCGAPIVQPRPASAPSVCPNCGTALNGKYAFCPNCGTPAAQPAPVTDWICPRCGITLDATKRFCPNCGQPKN